MKSSSLLASDESSSTQFVSQWAGMPTLNESEELIIYEKYFEIKLWGWTAKFCSEWVSERRRGFDTIFFLFPDRTGHQTSELRGGWACEKNSCAFERTIKRNYNLREIQQSPRLLACLLAWSSINMHDNESIHLRPSWAMVTCKLEKWTNEHILPASLPAGWSVSSASD